MKIRKGKGHKDYGPPRGRTISPKHNEVYFFHWEEKKKKRGGGKTFRLKAEDMKLREFLLDASFSV